VFRVSVPIDRMQDPMTVELFLNGESVSNRFTDSVMNYALCLSLDSYGFDAKYKALGRATMDYIAYTNLYLASLA
jgi:hypothetical protein